MIGKVRVINKMLEFGRSPEVTIFVGRPTALGNPYKMHRESQRDAAVDYYEGWLRARMTHHDNPPKRKILEMVEMVKAGESLALSCFCAPRRCHADVIKRVVEELAVAP